MIKPLSTFSFSIFVLKKYVSNEIKNKIQTKLKKTNIEKLTVNGIMFNVYMEEMTILHKVTFCL